jgi:DNA-binding response OmpR family regulator
MDIDMPGIDGFEATRQIRALAGRGRVPVLALTAYASSREQSKAREAGMNEYLTKPVSKTELAQALRKWLPGHAKRSTENQHSADVTVTLNEPVLQELMREIGHENLVRVLETFGNEARQRWRALTEATSPAELARAAHALVSASRSFGLETMADALAGIEAKAREGQMESQASLSLLSKVMENSLQALTSWKPFAGTKPESSQLM